MTGVNESIFNKTVVAEILHDVLIKENVVDPAFEIKRGCEKGDGYFSNIVRVDVKGKNKVLPLIIKAAPDNAKLREMVPTRHYFVHEIMFYKNIYPTFSAFWRDRNVKENFIRIPKCYKTDLTEYNELLVLENILESEFNYLGKSNQMDHSHVALVMREYGKLHAVSFAMRDQESARFEDLVKNMSNHFADISDKEHLQAIFLDGFEKIESVFDPIKEKNVIAAVRAFKEGLGSFLISLRKYTGKYGIVTHGDCWSNNMTFKYKNQNPTIPSEVCLLDFQQTHATTPVLDLSYFFYVAASREMLSNVDDYLKIYHESLREHVSALGSDVEKCYPYSALKEEWKTYGKFGLFMGIVAFRIMFRDDDEAVDFVDKLDSDTGVTDTFMQKSKNDHYINMKYRNLALHLYENGFL